MQREPIANMATARIADRRLDVRFVGSINGCYTLSSRRSAEDGAVEVFACRSQSFSSTTAAVIAPVAGAEGEWLTARFDGLGIVRGQIDRLIEDGFVFRIEATEAQRNKLAVKIDWLKKHSVRAHRDNREYKRFLPRDPRSTIALLDGRVMRCFLIDLSRSGAAVSADFKPKLGLPVLLGTLASKVVRYLDVGFAVQFDAVQEAEGLESLVTGFEPRRP